MKWVLASLLACLAAAGAQASGVGAAGAPAAPVQRTALPGPLDPDNFLARITRGELPAARLYEDERVIAVLADRPSARGHFMVWLKQSDARDLLEISSADLSHVMSIVQRIARAEVAVLGAQGITLRQNNGVASNIHQFHVHVIPRWAGDRLPDSPPPPVDFAGLSELAARIRAAMAAHPSNN